MGIFDGMIEGRVADALSQAMPRLFMAEVLRQYREQAATNGPAATPEEARERLTAIIGTTAANTDTPWGARGAWMGQLWTNIVNEQTTGENGQHFLTFINDPRFDQLFTTNQDILERVMDPRIMGPEGRDLRVQLGQRETRTRFETLLNTVETIATESGLVQGGANASLTALIDAKIAEMRTQDAAVPEAERVLPQNLDDYNVSPQRDDNCMEQLLEMLAPLFEMIFGGNDRNAGTPEQTAEQPIAIPEAVDAASPLRALDVNHDNNLSAAELAGNNLTAALTELQRALGASSTNLDGQGEANIADVRHGLAELARQAEAARTPD